MTIREQVSEFHRAFGVPIAAAPSVPSDERVRLRAALITEEFKEVIRALGWFVDVTFRGFNQGVESLPDVAKELADLAYVVEGTALEFGINSDGVGAAVHRSNMAKLGPDGVPLLRDDGKILKPHGWQPPDIAGELRRQAERGVGGMTDSVATIRAILRAGVAPPHQLTSELLAERDALVAERDALRARLGRSLVAVDAALAGGTVSAKEGE